MVSIKSVFGLVVGLTLGGAASFAANPPENDRFILTGVSRVSQNRHGVIAVVAQGYNFLEGAGLRPVPFAKLQRIMITTKAGSPDLAYCYQAALSAVSAGGRLDLVVSENQYRLDRKAQETALTLEVAAEHIQACAAQK
jgi:hypothetical protein